MCKEAKEGEEGAAASWWAQSRSPKPNTDDDTHPIAEKSLNAKPRGAQGNWATVARAEGGSSGVPARKRKEKEVLTSQSLRP